jgi:hypothetical protein
MPACCAKTTESVIRRSFHVCLTLRNSFDLVCKAELISQRACQRQTPKPSTGSSITTTLVAKSSPPTVSQHQPPHSQESQHVLTLLSYHRLTEAEPQIEVEVGPPLKNPRRPGGVHYWFVSEAGWPLREPKSAPEEGQRPASTAAVRCQMSDMQNSTPVSKPQQAFLAAFLRT